MATPDDTQRRLLETAGEIFAEKGFKGATVREICERARPTPACAEWVRDYVKPLSQVLQGILGEVLPPDTPSHQRFMVGFSIVGQCLHYAQNRPVVRLLVGEEDYPRFSAAAVADHITQFTLAALGLAPSECGRRSAECRMKPG